MVSRRSDKPIIMRFTPSLRRFPNVAFETVPKVFHKTRIVRLDNYYQLPTHHLPRFCQSAQFSSVQDGIYAFGKSPYTLHPDSQNFPQRCLWQGSSVHVTDDGLLSSFRARSSSASLFHASLLQAIGGVMSLVLCPQLASQAPQHFRSSQKQATCEGCFARQCICSVISPHSGMSREVHPQKFTPFNCHWGRA